MRHSLTTNLKQGGAERSKQRLRDASNDPGAVFGQSGGPTGWQGPTRPGESVAASIEKSLKLSGTRAQFPSDLGKYFMTLWISEFTTESRQTLTSVGHLNRHTQIVLPLPANIHDFQEEGWKEDDYGMIAGWLSQQLSTNFPSLDPAGKAAAVAAADFFLGAADKRARESMRLGTGMFAATVNAFQTVLYTGPKFKSHQLKFKLAPKSQEESAAIKRIIYLLHNAAAPKFEDGFGTSVFSFPDIIEAAYQPNSHYLHKFKPAVLRGVEVNFAGGGQKAFYGGSTAPESVELTLHMLELEYWVKGDYKDSPDGNTPYDGHGQNRPEATGNRVTGELHGADGDPQTNLKPNGDISRFWGAR